MYLVDRGGEGTGGGGGEYWSYYKHLYALAIEIGIL
jgi:hypothetical protein